MLKERMYRVHHTAGWGCGHDTMHLNVRGASHEVDSASLSGPIQIRGVERHALAKHGDIQLHHRPL